MDKTFTLKDGTVMNYWDEGEGQPLILVHGWAGNNQAFVDCYSEAVVKAGYRFIAPNMRGSLKTSESKTRPVVMKMLFDDLHELIEGLGLEDVVLGGHSMGANDMFGYIRHYGSEHVRKFILMDVTPLNNNSAEGWTLGTNNNTYSKEDGYRDLQAMEKDTVQYFADWMYNAAGLAGQPDGEKIARNMGEAIVAGFRRDEVVELYKDGLDWDAREEVSKFDVPVLYIYADRGVLVPPKFADYFLEHSTNEMTLLGVPSADHAFPTDPKYVPLITAVILEYMK
ncbi:MAG: alpha/beta hydrolase [Lachnospiraceae bacterium]|nr:alpha/beta hydrolase [Lachnospiraceae bacterium]